jgi:hypothetical protein
MVKKSRIQIALSPDLSVMQSDQSPYLDIELRKIVAAFGKPKHKEDWLLNIQEAAIEFAQIKASYGKRKSAAKFKKEALEAADKIQEVMGFWSLLPLERREIGGNRFKAEDINFTTSLLASLRDEFKAIDMSWDGHRVPRNPPREFFVLRLIDFWKEGHRKPPTRRNSTDTSEHFERGGVAYGPFLAFVVACFEPIDSIRGLDDIIKRLLGTK